MAIVAEYKYPNGATVRISDDCYRDVCPDEMARRIQQVRRTAWEMLLNSEKRRQQERNDQYEKST